MAVANYALVVLAARNRRYKPVTASSVQKFWYLVHALAAISLFYFRFRRQFVQSIMGAMANRLALNMSIFFAVSAIYPLFPSHTIHAGFPLIFARFDSHSTTMSH